MNPTMKDTASCNKGKDGGGRFRLPSVSKKSRGAAPEKLPFPAAGSSAEGPTPEFARSGHPSTASPSAGGRDSPETRAGPAEGTRSSNGQTGKDGPQSLEVNGEVRRPRPSRHARAAISGAFSVRRSRLFRHAQLATPGAFAAPGLGSEDEELGREENEGPQTNEEVRRPRPSSHSDAAALESSAASELGSEEDEGIRVFPAHVVPEFNGTARQLRGGRRDEPVYEGVALPPRSADGAHKDSCWMFLKKHRCVLSVFAVCTATAAIALPVALLTRRRSEKEEGTFSGQHTESSTTPPPVSPYSERYFAIKILLQSLKSGVALALEEEYSPQHRALLWLADEDDRQVDLWEEESLIQRFAVSTLYFATGGEEYWIEGCNFLSGDHECHWNVEAPEPLESTDILLGIVKPYKVPGHRYDYIGVRCFGDNSTVDGIRIFDNGLTGSMPEEISLLSSLEYMDLSTNNLSGPIPNSLGELAKLQALIPQANKLSGPIPPSLGRLSNLRDLMLGGNWLTGSIPKELNGLSKLENLLFSGRYVVQQKISYETNSINGTLPFTAGSLPNLKVLDASGNRLTGSIPVSLMTFKNLTSIVLLNNDMTGTVPPEIGNLIHLKDLNLGVNAFSGSLPPSLTDLSEMTLLRIHENIFNGTIPREIGNLRNLRRLALMNNRFSGTLPDSIGDLIDLQGLFILNNQFHGTLPETICNLVKLEEMILMLNKFSGTVPDCFGNAPEFYLLDLSANQFSGRVPPSIANLESLSWLSLSNNSFTGDVGFMCEISPNWFTADCYGDDPEVTCECCNFCCSDTVDGPRTPWDIIGGVLDILGVQHELLEEGCFLS